MRTSLSMIIALLIITSGCEQKQNNVSEKESEKMLLDFYSKHFYIYEKTPITEAVPEEVSHGKHDSLIKIYCTSKLRIKAMEAFENVGADWLTKDLIGDLNENLKVKKDGTKKNQYLVSFIATDNDPSAQKYKKQVVLYVTLVKEKEGYKIDEVK